MKHFTIFTLLLFILINPSYCQDKFTLNSGKIAQPDYHVTVTYENLKNKIIIPVNIDGKMRRFILDTGAPTMISTELYDELKPETIKNISIIDQSGLKDSMKVVLMKKMSIDTIDFTDFPALVMKEGNIFTSCFKIDGFIGSNSLRNSVLSISSMDSTISISSSIKKFENMAIGKGSKMFISANQSSPIIWIRLGKGKKTRVQVLLDTGMEGMIDLSLRHYELIKDDSNIKTVGTATGSNSLGLVGVALDTVQYQIHISSFKLNSATFQNLYFTTTSSTNSRLGSEILKYGSVTLDYRNRRFYYEPENKKTFLDSKTKDFQMVIKDNKLIIGIVWNQDLLQYFNSGDQIVAINDASLEGLDICELLFWSAGGNKSDKKILKIKTSDGFYEYVHR